MRAVSTLIDLKEMLNEVMITCFIYTPLSNPSRDARQRVLELEDSLKRDGYPSEIYILDPWEHQFLHEWIYDQPKLRFVDDSGHLICLACNGALFWRRKGHIVDVERRILDVDSNALCLRINKPKV